MPILALAALVLSQSGIVADNAESAKPLQPGASVPAVKVNSLDGKSTPLLDVLRGHKTALVFYRGGWCPFCNRQMADLERVQPDLTKIGYQIVAISPDLPAELKRSIDKHQLSYTLYSDSKADAMKEFGVAFRVEQALVSKYKDSYHIDLEAASGATHHILPVPTVFLVDQAGKITYTYSNPDYKIRLNGDDLVAAAKKE